jgi:hypothetical protein
MRRIAGYFPVTVVRALCLPAGISPTLGNGRTFDVTAKYLAFVEKVVRAMEKYPDGATIEQLQRDVGESSESVLLHVVVPRSDYRAERWFLRSR